MAIIAPDATRDVAIPPVGPGACPDAKAITSVVHAFHANRVPDLDRRRVASEYEGTARLREPAWRETTAGPRVGNGRYAVVTVSVCTPLP